MKLLSVYYRWLKYDSNEYKPAVDILFAHIKHSDILVSVANTYFGWLNGWDSEEKLPLYGGLLKASEQKDDFLCLGLMSESLGS